MCFVLISLMSSESLSVICLLWWGLIKAVKAQGIKPTNTDKLWQPQPRKTQVDRSSTHSKQPLTNHVRSGHVAMSSPHLEATGMSHHAVTVSPWVIGVEEPLSRLCECRISKSKAPDQTLQRTIIPCLATLTSPSKQPTAAARLGGCVRRAVPRLNDILKTTDKSGWS